MFNSSGDDLGTLDAGTTTGVTIDYATNDIFVDEVSGVTEYGPSANAIQHVSVGAQTQSLIGIAATDSTGGLYLSDSANNVVDELAPTLTLPEATTGAATAITITGATVSASINPEGSATTYHFDYGTDLSYGSQAPTPDATVGSDSTAHTVSQTLINLTPNTTYHYRVAATTGTTTVYSPDETFTTAALPSVVATGAATNVTYTGATVAGTINPMGMDTQYHFEYGTDTSYGSQAPTPDGVVGSDTNVHPLTQTLTGLEPSTTYHYRLDAVVDGFAAPGPDETFTTAPLPTVVTTGSASGVGLFGATVSGTINPMGIDTQYTFEYGTSTSYGSQIPVTDKEVGSDSSVHTSARA